MLKLIIWVVFFVKFSLPEHIDGYRNEFRTQSDVVVGDFNVDSRVVSILHAQGLVREAVAIGDVAAVGREELAHVVGHGAAITMTNDDDNENA